MANVSFVERTFATPSGILQYPYFKAFAQTFLTTDATAVTVDGSKIVKAGTVWPANDATAKGVVLNDMDVTNGTATGAVVFEGEINVNKIPTAPAAAAKTALPRITWFGA
jgi:hypothetical protein